MSGFFEELTVFSPAKVNLHLAVIGSRPDGFHDLESVFLAVNFGDTLHFQTENEETGDKNDKCEVEWGDGLKGPSFIPDNIVSRAIAVFREKTGFSGRLNVRLEKHIPLGGGLGGGSSNAAAALLSLNKIAGFPLGREALLETAASLGSDVPFFIHETAAAWVTGRGEHIEPIIITPLFLVLVNPGFHSDTAAAFRLLDDYRASRILSRGDAEAQRKKISEEESHPIIFSAPLRLREINFQNDFLEVFPDKERNTYHEIISQLKEQGAGFAGLSGAGSTCFGIFPEKELAHKAANALRGKWDFIRECKSQ